MCHNINIVQQKNAIGSYHLWIEWFDGPAIFSDTILWNGQRNTLLLKLKFCVRTFYSQSVFLLDMLFKNNNKKQSVYMY